MLTDLNHLENFIVLQLMDVFYSCKEDNTDDKITSIQNSCLKKPSIPGNKGDVMAQWSGNDNTSDPIGRTGAINIGDFITKGPWVDVRAFSDFASALSAIGTSTLTTLLIPCEITVDDHAIVGANIELWFLEGGKLTVSSSKSLTINGGIKAGLHQIFNTSAIGSVIAGTPKVDKYFPQWWGATGDGHDDTAAVQSAINLAANNGQTLAFPSGVYKFTNLNVPENKDLSIVGSSKENTTLLVDQAWNYSTRGIHSTGSFIASNICFDQNWLATSHSSPGGYNDGADPSTWGGYWIGDIKTSKLVSFIDCKFLNTCRGFLVTDSQNLEFANNYSDGLASPAQCIIAASGCQNVIMNGNTLIAQKWSSGSGNGCSGLFNWNSINLQICNNNLVGHQLVGRGGSGIITGSISGTTLTITNAGSNIITVGLIISGTGIIADNAIVEQLTGTPGGNGTYRLSYNNGTISSEDIATYVSRLSVSHNIIDTPVADTAFYGYKYATIIGNVVKMSGDMGITIDGSQYATIVGNVIDGTKIGGINVSSAISIVIADNVIKNIAQGSTKPYDIIDNWRHTSSGGAWLAGISANFQAGVSESHALTISGNVLWFENLPPISDGWGLIRANVFGILFQNTTNASAKITGSITGNYLYVDENTQSEMPNFQVWAVTHRFYQSPKDIAGTPSPWEKFTDGINSFRVLAFDGPSCFVHIKQLNGTIKPSTTYKSEISGTTFVSNANPYLTWLNVIDNGNYDWTTPDPSIPKPVHGTNLFLVNSATGDSEAALSIKGTGTADLINIFDDANEVFTVIDGGNTGIGESNPSAKLEVGDNTILGDEIVLNGNMEVGFSSGVANNWIMSGTGTPLDETTAKHSGSHAQKLISTNNAQIYQDISLAANTRYFVNAWVKKISNAELSANGNMEGGFTGGVANYWAMSGAGTPSDETSEVHSGGYAQKLISENNAQIYQDISLVSGRRYNFSVWVKITANCSNFIQIFDSTQNVVIAQTNVSTAISGYEQICGSFVADSTGSHRINIGMNSSSSTGTFLIDDFSVAEVASIQVYDSTQGVIIGQSSTGGIMSGYERISGSFVANTTGSHRICIGINLSGWKGTYLIDDFSIIGVASIQIHDSTQGVTIGQSSTDEMSDYEQISGSFVANSNGSHRICIGANLPGWQGTFLIDDVSAKQVSGGDIVARGLFTGGGATGIKILASGSVGVGTASPAKKLVIYDAATGGGTVQLFKADSGTPNQDGQSLNFVNLHNHDTGRDAGVSAGNILWQFSQPTSGAAQNAAKIDVLSDAYQSGYFTYSAITFWTTNESGGTLAERVRIGSGGAVGIGTPSPSSKLDVAGDIETGSSNAFYMGDPNTDGTWKIQRYGTGLGFFQRASGSWPATPNYTINP
jgi:hypothetical protein